MRAAKAAASRLCATTISRPERGAQRLRRVVGEQMARFHDGDAVGIFGFGEDMLVISTVMRAAFLQRAQGVEEMAAAGGIEPGGRFVEQQQRRAG